MSAPRDITERSGPDVSVPAIFSLPVFGLAGWSGSGKTQLAEALIDYLSANGVRLATIKHAHHEFDADIPGKDSWRHRKAGAHQVLVSSAKRSALFTEHEADAEPDLAALLSQLAPCDLVLVEGFKAAPIPKLEVWRASVGKPQLFTEDAHIIALASDEDVPRCTLPQFNLSDVPNIARFICAQFDLSFEERL